MLRYAGGSDIFMAPLLIVKDLSVAFHTRDGVVQAVNGVSFALERGKVL
jgi:peptide/nickel transport system ATP-binding protein